MLNDRAFDGSAQKRRVPSARTLNILNHNA